MIYTHLIVQGLRAETKWRVDTMSIEGSSDFLLDGQIFLQKIRGYISWTIGSHEQWHAHRVHCKNITYFLAIVSAAAQLDLRQHMHRVHAHKLRLGLVRIAQPLQLFLECF